MIKKLNTFLLSLTLKIRSSIYINVGVKINTPNKEKPEFIERYLIENESIFSNIKSNFAPIISNNKKKIQ